MAAFEFAKQIYQYIYCKIYYTRLRHNIGFVRSDMRGMSE